MTTTLTEFTRTFRDEHRTVRDLLLDLIAAFERADLPQARALLAEVAARTGPHFRYEEEALYPSLARIFGAGYVSKLLADHDGAIRTVRGLAALAARERLDSEQVGEAVDGVRSILPHVSDCEGLSIMVEVLPEAEVAAVLTARERALAAGLDLLTWASTVRTRPA